MITAIDSNVLIALWNPSDSLNSMALNALKGQADLGGLLICGAVYAELLGFQKRTQTMVDTFLDETGIDVDWMIGEDIWRSAARSNHQYSIRRRKQKQLEPRRLLTDFIVGAHADSRGLPLLTFDTRIFRAAYPQLNIIGWVKD